MGLIKYRLKRAFGAFFLWVDTNINHAILETILERLEPYLEPYGFEIWQKTCYRFCTFVCDNFEDFDD